MKEKYFYHPVYISKSGNDIASSFVFNSIEEASKHAVIIIEESRDFIHFRVVALELF